MAALESSYKGDPISKRAWSMWQQGEEGKEQVRTLVQTLNPELYKIFSDLTFERQSLMLLMVNQSRQVYSHVGLSRTIPWRNVSGEQPVLVNQSCTWSMCMPKAMVAMTICDLLKGINSSYPDSFKMSHGRGGIVWGAYLDTTTKARGGSIAVRGRALHAPSCCCWLLLPRQLE
jgi:hypothetical protein